MNRNLQTWSFLPLVFWLASLAVAQTDLPKCKDLPPGSVLIGTAKCLEPKPHIDSKAVLSKPTPHLAVPDRAIQATSDKPQPITHESKVEVSSIGQVDSVKEVFTGYNVHPNDKTLRDVISRWAMYADWTFEPDHWTVPKDVAISARAVSNLPDFKSAVRWLLKSTVITELPLQPCFYSNQVVRVILLTESCNRTPVTQVSN